MGLCWILVIVLAAAAFVLWNQLMQWKKWKDEMNLWWKGYKEWMEEHCSCDQGGGGSPPPPPSWPNGGWEH